MLQQSENCADFHQFKGIASVQYVDVLDWLAVRSGLRKLRDEMRIGQMELATRSGVDRATIHRIENTKGIPKHRPEFQTIEAMVRGMGLTLSQFFARLEESPEMPISSLAHGETPPIPAAAQTVTAEEVTEAQLQFVAALGSVLADRLDAAIDRIITSRKQAPKTRTRTTGDGPVRRRRH